MSGTELVGKVIEWCQETGISHSGTVEGQIEKVREELSEVEEEWKALGTNPEDFWGDDLDMELGDLAVTVIALCDVAGTDFFAVLQMAYDKISKRKGKMVNGQFVKEEDSD